MACKGNCPDPCPECSQRKEAGLGAKALGRVRRAAQGAAETVQDAVTTKRYPGGHASMPRREKDEDYQDRLRARAKALGEAQPPGRPRP